MDEQKVLRQHVLELLEGRSAHIDLETAIKDLSPDKINVRVANSPHTPWQLLEHIRIAQWDILEFSRDPAHVSPEWPDGYWPKKDGTKAQWKASVEQILNDLDEMRSLVRSKKSDLMKPFPWGSGQTLLREALLIADHNAYHLGQLVLIKRMCEES